AHFSLGRGPKRPEQHFVDLIAIPQPVHVRLADPERAFPENTSIKCRIVDADVPRIEPLTVMPVPANRDSNASRAPAISELPSSLASLQIVLIVGAVENPTGNAKSLLAPRAVLRSTNPQVSRTIAS